MNVEQNKRSFSAGASRSTSLKVVVVLVLVVTFCKNLKNGVTSQHRWLVNIDGAYTVLNGSERAFSTRY